MPITVSLNSKKNLRNLSLQKASMGIYIFDWKRLRNMLVAAEKSNVDMSDFGKNVILTISSLVKVSMLMNLMAIGKMLVRLSHFGEANMEYISPENALDSRNRQWKIYSRNLISPPNYFGACMLKIHWLWMAVL